jgi:hypothetical protein
MDAFEIARVAHAANIELQIIQADPGIPVADNWDFLDEADQRSVISGAELVLSGEVETPEQSHQSWLDFKAAEGWKYGPVKDYDKKEHPCFVPYEELPPSQRVKDRLYFAIVKALAEA